MALTSLGFYAGKIDDSAGPQTLEAWGKFQRGKRLVEPAFIDADSLRVDGVNVRVSNIDAHERGGHAACDAEKFLLAVASKRAEELLDKTTLVVWSEGRNDKYRRPLVRVTSNERD